MPNQIGYTDTVGPYFSDVTTTFKATFNIQALSANRTYTWPDSAGTVTLLGNTTTGSGSVVLATAPTLSSPVVGTQTAGDASTKAASTAFVQAARGAFYGTSTDAANTYTATITGATLNAGNLFAIKFTNAMTGAATLNINGLGAKPIVLPTGAAISGTQGSANQTSLLVYDGTSFVFVVQPNNA